MKIIIIIEKYGGFCNRFFQSLHYHAFSIENNIFFFNPSLLGLLKFDICFYYFCGRRHRGGGPGTMAAAEAAAPAAAASG